MPDEHDDGLPWGYISDQGDWIQLPKTPLLHAGKGPPPFTILLPTGAVRLVCHQPKPAA